MPPNGADIPSAAALQARRDELLRIRDDDLMSEERHRAAKRALLKLNVLEGELAQESIAARTEVFRLVEKALGQAATPMHDSGAGRILGVAGDLAAGVVEAVETALDDALDVRDEPVATDPVEAATLRPRAEATQEQKEIIAAIVEAAVAHGVPERFLGAVAFKESSLRNIRATASSAFGPFQFLQSTWDGLVAAVGAQLGIESADISDVRKQAVMAAVSFKKYRRKLEVAGLDATPSSLYLCHLLGGGAARACLGRPRQRIDRVLADFYASTSLGAGFADRIISANPFLKNEQGNPRTVDGVLSVIGQSVERCEGSYLALKGKATVGNDAGMPRWLRIAFDQMNQGVQEIPGAAHDPAIVSYLASTSIGPEYHKDETAWCSAFVNWCIEQSGLQGTNGANARSWVEYGDAVEVPEQGDIVVFWREHPNSAFGHVGFFLDEDDDHIQLLGGNQTKPESGLGAVCIKAYPRRQFLAYRRPRLDSPWREGE